MAASANAAAEFDSEYSRLIAAVGRDALRRMQSASVLIIGVRGLGVEIAKNIVLMGVQKLTLADDSAADVADQSSNFFLESQQLGQKIGRASCRERV